MVYFLDNVPFVVYEPPQARKSLSLDCGGLRLGLINFADLGFAQDFEVNSPPT